MDNFEQEQQNRIQQEEIPQGKRERKGPGFGWGIFAGILGTLALVAVVLVAAAGTLNTLGMNIVIGTNRPNQSQTDKEENSNENESGSSTVNENLLNTDLLMQISMIDSYLEKYFLYDVDKEELRDGMLQGLVAALGDPYSEYYNAAALDSFTATTQGEYVGIGAEVTQEVSTGAVRISRPYEGTPSAEAGLLPGDMILSVGGTEVTGMDLEQVVSLIKGEEGTGVVLSIYRESEEAYLDIEVLRRKVELPTVSSEMLEEHIGYIEVTSFDGVTTKQFKAAYEELKEKGMKGVIVDLRNNGGGLVDTVTDMLDYLLSEGTTFYVKDKTGKISLECVSDASAALDIPIVVLVNEYTASASEVFAGNIQEFGVGKVVGTTTYGKGVMQQLFYTNTQGTSAVKLTIADYYIHSDKNVNGVGITPDVDVELDEAVKELLNIPMEQDNQLQKAIEVIKGEIG